MCEVVKCVNQGRAEDPGHTPYTFVLGDLESVNQTLLSVTFVPYRASVCHGGDDDCVVHPAPIKEVEALDGVAKDTEAPYCGAGSYCHRVDVV